MLVRLGFTPMKGQGLLYRGDNLDVLRTYVEDAAVDLCYIDPPFHTRRNYRTCSLAGGFRDTWEWDACAAAGFAEASGAVGQLLHGLRPVLGEGSLLAYLVSVALRVAEIHRVLKPTGTFFLHCDPTASHYLKLVLDAVFCPQGGSFRNEIVWCYSHGGRSKKWFGRKHDIIFFYSKSERYHFDVNAVRVEMRSGNRSFGGRLVTGEDGRKYRLVYGTRNARGEARYYKYYLDEGKLPEDWWADINSLQASAAERVEYPTQKPEALVQRIILACSRKGDTVLDAYCGCGTTLVAAERAGRRWIGVDNAPEAVEMARARIEKEFGRPVRVLVL
ncbi:MAG TPA: site-specific DNA-methyltransferase [Bryobacteraceae bacterium]|nr:site-specific DNA-methyltransferase [Bryobacteraceae bacterium]